MGCYSMDNGKPVKGSEQRSDRISFILKSHSGCGKQGYQLPGYAVVQVHTDGGDETYPGGEHEECLVPDIFLKVKGQSNLLISWLWGGRQRQDSEMTLNLWHNNLIKQDISNGLVNILEVASVGAEGFGVSFGHIKWGALLRH